MNNNNQLGLKRGSWGRVMKLEGGMTVFLPCVKLIANARVLNARNDGSADVHFKGNFNTFGDFRSELMSFDSNLVLDTGDLKERNARRRAAGLVEIPE